MRFLSGSYSAVVGLPLFETASLLQRPRLHIAVRLLAACSPGEVRVAAVDETGLLDYAVWRPGAPDGVGDLHRGRVAARVPAMAGAFVRLEGGADGFLPDSEGGAGVTEGQALGVRVIRAAQGGKGPRLTARLDAAAAALVGAGPPSLLRRGPGAVERLAALHPGVAGRTGRCRGRGGVATGAGRAGAPGARRLRRRFGGPGCCAGGAGGGAARWCPADRVHPTPALTAIDVDLGAATSARGSKARTQFAANRALLPALARQIRLRNLSGAILVDFGGVSVSRRARLGAGVAGGAGGDPLAPRLLGFTALGLAEILRPRVHPPLHEVLAGPHAAGLAALRAADAAFSARPQPGARAACRPRRGGGVACRPGGAGRLAAPHRPSPSRTRRPDPARLRLEPGRMSKPPIAGRPPSCPICGKPPAPRPSSRSAAPAAPRSILAVGSANPIAFRRQRRKSCRLMTI